jgi:hypothetical protein
VGIGGEAFEFLFGFGDEGGEIVDDGHILFEAEFFTAGQGEGLPPGLVVGGEGNAVGRVEVVAMGGAVHAVFGSGALGDEAVAMGDDGAQVADVL